MQPQQHVDMEEVHVVSVDPSPSRQENHPYNDENTKTTSCSSPAAAATILGNLHSGYFRITVSLACQALLWKTLSQSHEHPNYKGLINYHANYKLLLLLPSYTYLLLWGVALATQLLLCFFYLLRCLLHFHMVRAEFRSHIGVNYLFAPWIAWLLLLQSCPMTTTTTSWYVVVLWIFMVPVIALDVKIYGQWFTTEKRFRLSAAANPTSQITVIANLVGARAAAQMGWKESAICMFSLGIIHYLVIFVTLYQRLSATNNSLPRMLRPTLFLFFGAPSMASLAWSSITGGGGGGGFDISCKMLFFLSLFIFASLALRPYLFKKCMRRFNVAWWAYSFTLTILALASAEYAKEMKKKKAGGGAAAAGILMLLLSALSVLVFLFLLILTALKTDKLLLITNTSDITSHSYIIKPP